MGRAYGVALLLSVALCAPARAVDRPPQFVVMSFDNCTELDRWTELRDFAAELDKSGARVRFTYFVTGLNFIADANRNIYEGPRHKRGTSTLDFGGTKDDVRTRIALANEAYAQGHEIASHAVGHWDGRSWSPAEWTREFNSFDDVMANVGKNNGLPTRHSPFRCRSGAFARRICSPVRANIPRSRAAVSATTPPTTAPRKNGRKRSTASGATSWRS